jgi:hypothetical protein
MCTLLLSLRMSPDMLTALKELASRESVRRGEYVSWARLVREAAARTLEEANRQNEESPQSHREEDR